VARAFLVGTAAQHHQAGVSLSDDVGTRASRLWVAFAEAGVLPVDEVGTQCAQGVLVDPEALRDTRAVVDRHHIELREDAVDEGDALGSR